MAEIPKEESARVEFKESISDTGSIVETVVAFSNTLGGRIFLGVNDDGTVKGLEVGRHSVEQLINRIAQETKPRIYPHVEESHVGERKIIVLIVDESSSKPHLYKGTGYRRVGKSNIKLDLEELETLILKKHTQKTAFDNLQSEARLEDINRPEILSFINQAKLRRNQEFASDDTEMILKNLNLLKNGRVVNGAVLCFCDNPQRFFPQAAFRCAIFRGRSIVNHQLMEGPLFTMIENVHRFVVSNIQRSFVIKGARREDIFEYPLDAVREAVINAAIHRDYFSNASCYLSIDEERIEIRNPGLLPEELKISELKEPRHASIPRNRLIAHTAYLAGYIEQWGTGTTKMIDLCRSDGLIDPVFEEKQGFFSVSIYKKRFQLGKREKNALDKFGTSEFSSAKYAKTVGISMRTAVTDIDRLAKSGLVEKLGKGKNTRYKRR